MSHIDQEVPQGPPRGHVRGLPRPRGPALGILQSDWGDRAMVEGFRDRMQARLQLVPPHDPQFRRNRERVIRDAERVETRESHWDLGVPED